MFMTGIWNKRCLLLDEESKQNWVYVVWFFNRTYTMDIEDVINKISQGVPVYMKLHDGTLICMIYNYCL